MDLSEVTIAEIEERVVAVMAPCNHLGGPPVERVAWGDLALEFSLQGSSQTFDLHVAAPKVPPTLGEDEIVHIPTVATPVCGQTIRERVVGAGP